MTTMLENFGLTPAEEKVYLALLRLGSSLAADIIRKTQLHRTTVYDVLERLIEKGVVSFIVQNKVNHYAAANPSRFLELASEEVKLAEEKQKLASKVITEISSIRKEAKAKPAAQIFVGSEGVKTVMGDIIEVGKDFVEFGVQGRFKDALPAYTERWAGQRKKRNIRARMVCTEGTVAPVWEMNEVRFVPKEYQSPAATLVYGNKVAIFIQEEPELVVLVESEKLAQSYRNYFELLWGIAK